METTALLAKNLIYSMPNRLFFSTVLSPAFLKPKVNKAEETGTLLTFTPKCQT